MRAIILLSLGLTLILALSACGPDEQYPGELGACAGTCEPVPEPELLSVVAPLVECLALPAEEQCSDPAFCHDQLRCTVKHAPAGMRWNMLAIRARPLPLEEGASKLTALFNSQEILFKQGEDMTVELGTLAHRESYRVEVEASLADMGSTSKVDFESVAVAMEGELSPGGEPLVLEAPCATWTVQFTLPEEFNEKSARVRVEYLLTLPEVEPVLLDASPRSEIKVSASSRLSPSVKQATVLLPVGQSQASIPAQVTYYPSQTTTQIDILPGELVLPWLE